MMPKYPFAISEEYLPLFPTPAPATRLIWWRVVASAGVLAATAALYLHGDIWRSGVEHGGPSWDPASAWGDGDDGWKWSAISPSRTLEWHRCYEGRFDCARLDVPMDWNVPSDEQRVVVAIMRLRATEKRDYRGPVFFNPGGPGGSGTWALRDHGELFQTIVGKNHDIISFDPRGIGATTPRVECWGSAQRRHFWELSDGGTTIDVHPGALYNAWAQATALSQVCEAAMNSSGILEHAGTAPVARDLLEIVEQLGEEKLKYWGLSYGTILGGVFAALYPDKVGRLVSDGNVDYKEWFRAEHINFVHDTDKVMEAFFTLCHEAGPDKCAFYAETPALIAKRLSSVLDSLRRNPLIVPSTSNPSDPSSPLDSPTLPDIVTYSRLRRLMTATMYQPLRTFPRFASVLAAIEARDAAAYVELQGSRWPPASSFCDAVAVPPSMPLDDIEAEGTGDAFPAVLCADADALEGMTVEEFKKYAEEVEDMSRYTGAVNAGMRMSCAGRKVKPKWKFTGPFKANTSFPILFIANSADNITPLISARNNSEGFTNSVVLVQNAYGHTSLNAPSACTALHIRAYFQDGSLPAADTTCESDMLPFDLPVKHSVVFDAELSGALRELAAKGLKVTGSWAI